MFGRGDNVPESSETDQASPHEYMLEEWKALAAADAADNQWAAQKETILLPVALACFGFATEFCLSGKPALLVLFAAVAGLLLLVCNFVAIEGINNHQSARRLRLAEIERQMPIEFYTRHDELRNAVIADLRGECTQNQPIFWRLFHRSALLAMRVRLRGLRFAMALAGGIYLVALIVLLCFR